MKRSIVLIAHNLRSSHNVGSLLRTADGLGIERVFLTGYTPYPALAGHDSRLPHIAQKVDRQISKTSLGAENMIRWQQSDDVFTVLDQLRSAGYQLAAVEQASNSIVLPDFRPPDKIALLLGREVEGIEPEVLAGVDIILEIPMSGRKESFNVAQAAAMALYHCRFF